MAVKGAPYLERQKRKGLEQHAQKLQERQEERPQRGRGRGTEEKSTAVFRENVEVCTNKHVLGKSLEGRSTRVTNTRKWRRGKKNRTSLRV